MKRVSKGLPVAWTKHIKEASKKQELEATLRNSSLSFNRLRDILEEKAAGERIQDILPDVYDQPSWAYKQAHNNGFQAGIKYALDLLQFIPRQN